MSQLLNLRIRIAEEGHTNALLFADVMDPPQIKKEQKNLAFRAFGYFLSFIASVTQRKKTIDL